MTDAKQIYEAAVDFATDWLEGHFQALLSRQESVEPTEFLYAFNLDISPAWDDHPTYGHYYRVSDQVIEFLAVRFENDLGAYELLKRITASRLCRQEPLHEMMPAFAAGVLLGKITPPLSPSTKVAKTFAVNIQLVYLARALSKAFDLPLTRNDEARNKRSCCDAVSEALRRIGHHKSPRAIKDLLTHKTAVRIRETLDAIEGFKKERDKLL